MDGIKAQQMCICLHGSQIIDRHYLDIGAFGLCDCPKNIATDSAKTVNCNPNCHNFHSTGV